MSTGKPKDLSSTDLTCLTDFKAKFGTLYHFSAKPEETGSLEKTIADLVKATQPSPDAREAIAFTFTEEGVPHSHGIVITRESELATALDIPKSLLADDKEPLELKILGSKIVADKAPHVKYGLRVICKAKDPEAVRAFWSVRVRDGSRVRF